MTTTQKQTDAASAKGFKLTRRAMAAKMNFRRFNLLMDAAACYEAAGQHALAVKLTRLSIIDNYADFQEAARA